jgi:hypothetical protein
MQCGIGAPERPAMARPIRKTSFTWDPDTESRTAGWSRINTHIQQELDRIRAAATQQRHLARHQASPHHDRNRRIFQAARQGVPVPEIARQHGTPTMRIREIVRSEAAWQAHLARDQPPNLRSAREASPRDLREMPAAIPRTTRMIVDP